MRSFKNDQVKTENEARPGGPSSTTSNDCIQQVQSFWKKDDVHTDGRPNWYLKRFCTAHSHRLTAEKEDCGKMGLTSFHSKAKTAENGHCSAQPSTFSP